MIDPIIDGNGWTVGGMNQGPQTTVRHTGSATATEGGALDCTYHFVGANGMNYIEFRKSVSIPIDARQLRFWVHADGSGHVLRVRVRDRSGQMLQYTVGNLNWQGWRQVTVNLEEPNGFWDGNNDGIPAPPLTLTSILIDSKNRSFVGIGRILVDELAAVAFLPESRSVLMSVTGKRAGNIFTEKEEVAFIFTFENLMDKARELEVSYFAESTTGRSYGSGNFSAALPAKGKAEERITLPIRANGTFNLRVYLRSRDRVVRVEEVFPFSRIVALDVLHPDFVVCTHFGQFKGEAQKNLEITALAGAGWIRDEVYWSRVEKEKGIFDFTIYDGYIQEAVERNLNILMILDYGNVLYGEGAPETEEQLAGWQRYVEAAVGRYHHVIKHWEIWNEFSHGLGLNERQRALSKQEQAKIYLPILRISYETIKRIDPKAVVVAFGNAGIDEEFIDAVLALGGGKYLDAISVHPYSFPNTPEARGYVSRLQSAKDVLAKHGLDVPVWVTEIGWPTHVDTNGVSERVSGAYGVRMYVLSIASGLADKVFWYDLQDDGLDATEREHNFGLIRHWKDITVPWSAKDNYVAHAAMNSQLAGATYQGVEKLSDNLIAYRFLKADGSQLAVIWAIKGSEIVGLRSEAASAQLMDLFGNKAPLHFHNGVVTLTISEEPIYLIGDLGALSLVEPQFLPQREVETIVSGELTPVRLSLSGIDGAGQFVLDLPDGLQHSGSSAFAAGASSAELNLKAVGLSQDKVYEYVIYPVVGRQVIGRIAHKVQMTNPVDVAVAPLYQNEQWNVVVKVENHSRTQTLSGSVAMLEPADWAKEPISFADLGPEQIKEFVFPLENVRSQKKYNCKFELYTSGGLSVLLERQVNFLAARRLRQLPTFTGDFSQWSRQGIPFYINEAAQVVNITDWGGTEDLSGVGYLLWDDENLYLAVAATDNVHHQDNLPSELWRGDSIQVGIDPARAEENGRYGYDEYGFALHNDGSQLSWRWLATFNRSLGSLEQLTRYAINRRGNQTIYEVAIPWEQILPTDVKPTEGFSLGFSLLINDNDGTGRRGWIEFMSGIGVAKNPAFFGELLLID